MKNQPVMSMRSVGRRSIWVKAFIPMLLLVTILLTYIVFITENRRYILDLNKKYIEETTSLNAERLDELLLARQKSLDILAITVEGWLDEPDVDSEMLRFLQDNSIFDYVEFIDSSGLNHNAYGLNSDSSDRENYINGINGKTGVFTIFNSRITAETLICFYTPLHYDGKIFGVLNGMYREETLLRAIDTELFGESAESYLCMEDGTVIASVGGDDIANVFNVFEESGNRSVNDQTLLNIHRSFEEHEPYNFTYKDSYGTGNASIAVVSHNDWMLLHVFPGSLTKAMERDANQSGTTLTVIITVAFLAYIAFLILDNKKWKHRMIHHAQTDHMTGFLNQAAIKSAVDDLLKSNPEQMYAFYIFDIDNFKQANDKFGHVFGDMVIRRFSELITSCIAEDKGISGRLGGDEFVVLLPAPDQEWAKKKAALLNETLDCDCVKGDVCWHMSASIGFCFAPKDGNSFHELYRKADAALYMSKRRGKGVNSMFMLSMMICCFLTLSGCAKDINDIVDDEPCVRGVVSEVNENYIVLSINEDDELYNSYQSLQVSLDVERKDGSFSGDAGDEVAVYYDGIIEETDPARVNKVYAILYTGEAE